MESDLHHPFWEMEKKVIKHNNSPIQWWSSNKCGATEGQIVFCGQKKDFLFEIAIQMANDS
jgi:hypothetical protein